MSAQLERLARPFPARFVSDAPSGHGTYVAHSVVNEKLLAVLGPFDFEVTEVIYDNERRVDGCLARLTVDVDGRPTTVVEVGECDNVAQKKTNGDRLKNAASDALKRCAMRLGVGLHLWSGDQFTLYDQLRTREDAPAPKRNYASWAKDELVAECAARGLPIDGAKETLAAHLLANDVEMQKPFAEAS